MAAALALAAALEALAILGEPRCAVSCAGADALPADASADILCVAKREGERGEEEGMERVIGNADACAAADRKPLRWTARQRCRSAGCAEGTIEQTRAEIKSAFRKVIELVKKDRLLGLVCGLRAYRALRVSGRPLPRWERGPAAMAGRRLFGKNAALRDRRPDERFDVWALQMWQRFAGVLPASSGLQVSRLSRMAPAAAPDRGVVWLAHFDSGFFFSRL